VLMLMPWLTRYRRLAHARHGFDENLGAGPSLQYTGLEEEADANTASDIGGEDEDEKVKVIRNLQRQVRLLSDQLAISRAVVYQQPRPQPRNSFLPGVMTEF